MFPNLLVGVDGQVPQLAQSPHAHDSITFRTEYFRAQRAYRQACERCRET
jgi:hypothetical protein